MGSEEALENVGGKEVVSCVSMNISRRKEWSILSIRNKDSDVPVSCSNW